MGFRKLCYHSLKIKPLCMSHIPAILAVVCGIYTNVSHSGRFSRYVRMSHKPAAGMRDTIVSRNLRANERC